KQLTAMLMSIALATSGCASAAPRYAGAIPQQQPAATSAQDTALMADYLQRLPGGSRVKIERIDGRVMKRTLMNVVPAPIVLQQNTGVPEAPVTVPVREIARVTPESASSTGKTVGITVAASVGATFGVLFLLAALLGD